MIEGFAREMPEDQMLEAILFGHKHIAEVVELIEELRDKAGLGRKELAAPGGAQPAHRGVPARSSAPSSASGS